MNVLITLLLGIGLVGFSNASLAADTRKQNYRLPPSSNTNSSQNNTPTTPQPSAPDQPDKPDKPDQEVSKKPDSKHAYPAPRGGKYFVNSKGKKIYVPGNSPQQRQN